MRALELSFIKKLYDENSHEVHSLHMMFYADFVVAITQYLEALHEEFVLIPKEDMPQLEKDNP